MNLASTAQPLQKFFETHSQYHRVQIWRKLKLNELIPFWDERHGFISEQLRRGEWAVMFGTDSRDGFECDVYLFSNAEDAVQFKLTYGQTIP